MNEKRTIRQTIFRFPGRVVETLRQPVGGQVTTDMYEEQCWFGLGAAHDGFPIIGKNDLAKTGRKYG